MNISITKIIGTQIKDFINLKENGICLQNARLIPIYRPGDEMALTSIFLSSLRLVKEFQKDFFSEVKLPKSGLIYTFTEVVFPQHKDSRIDGLLLNVKSGTIKDAAILEMKNKNNVVEKKQIDKYLSIAKDLGIPKIITVSNEFVAEPTQTPLHIKSPKDIQMYHFSWSYILTLAQILLFDNDKNIEDEDQVEIMREVVAYLNNDTSGVRGFTKMKQGWKEVVNQINTGVSINVSSMNVQETISSWLQEEKDMALILSRELGVLVKTGNPKFKGKLHDRLDYNANKLLNKKMLSSKFGISGAVSDITVKALFDKRIIEMSVSLIPPTDKGLKGQIGWLKRQILNCEKKNKRLYDSIINEIVIDINIKHARDNIRVSFGKLDDVYLQIKGKDINEFTIVEVKDFGKNFASTKKFVEQIEKMLVEFYAGIVQYLVKWEKPAPKITQSKVIEDIDENNESAIENDVPFQNTSQISSDLNQQEEPIEIEKPDKYMNSENNTDSVIDGDNCNQNSSLKQNNLESDDLTNKDEGTSH